MLGFKFLVSNKSTLPVIVSKNVDLHVYKDVLTLEQPNKQNNHNLEKKPELRKVIPSQNQNMRCGISQ